MEAANYTVRIDPLIRCRYERERARRRRVVATKAVAHRLLACACNHMLHKGTTFDLTRTFELTHTFG